MSVSAVMNGSCRTTAGLGYGRGLVPTEPGHGGCSGAGTTGGSERGQSCPQQQGQANLAGEMGRSGGDLVSSLPKIIQGGMGAGVSDWRLANAVARTGQLGVVSGTALDLILLRRLQDGDPGGHMRRGLDHFPFPASGRCFLADAQSIGRG